MNHRPRLLLIGPAPPALAAVAAYADVTPAVSPTAAADQLRGGQFDGIIATATLTSELIDRYRRDEIILGNIDQGIASLDADGNVIWANVILRGWCSRNPVGQSLLESLNFASSTNASILLASNQANPVATAADPRISPNAM